MTFLEAAMLGKWIRRKGSKKVFCISETPTNFYNVVRSDLLAGDWEIAIENTEEKQDDSSVRFSLLELDDE